MKKFALEYFEHYNKIGAQLLFPDFTMTNGNLKENGVFCTAYLIWLYEFQKPFFIVSSVSLRLTTQETARITFIIKKHL